MKHEHGLNQMAFSATLHCLTGCAIGEVTGLVIGTALGLSTGLTIFIAVTLAFVFGFALSTLPLINAGLSFISALKIVFVADTLSIATMEIVDNAVMAAVPGAMDEGLVNPMFWIALPASLVAAFFAAYPVNRYLLTKGKGHALVMKYHRGHDQNKGISIDTNVLLAGLIGFFICGLLVSVAATTFDKSVANSSVEIRHSKKE